MIPVKIMIIDPETVKHVEIVADADDDIGDGATVASLSKLELSPTGETMLGTRFDREPFCAGILEEWQMYFTNRRAIHGILRGGWSEGWVYLYTWLRREGTRRWKIDEGLAGGGFWDSEDDFEVK
jgi:hypothetical protein